MTYTGGSAWVAVGPSSDGKMVGSEAVVGQPSGGTVRKYSLSGQSVPGVSAMGAQTLTDTSIDDTGGTTTMTYTKIMDEDGELTLNKDSSTILVMRIERVLSALQRYHPSLELSRRSMMSPPATVSAAHRRN